MNYIGDIMKKDKKPIRLYKKEEKKPLRSIINSNNMVYGIPIEFILITIIMVSGFILILLFMGPCVESGWVYNRPLA